MCGQSTSSSAYSVDMTVCPQQSQCGAHVAQTTTMSLCSFSTDTGFTMWRNRGSCLRARSLSSTNAYRFSSIQAMSVRNASAGTPLLASHAGIGRGGSSTRARLDMNNGELCGGGDKNNRSPPLVIYQASPPLTHLAWSLRATFPLPTRDMNVLRIEGRARAHVEDQSCSTQFRVTRLGLNFHRSHSNNRTADPKVWLLGCALLGPIHPWRAPKRGQLKFFDNGAQGKLRRHMGATLRLSWASIAADCLNAGFLKACEKDIRDGLYY